VHAFYHPTTLTIPGYSGQVTSSAKSQGLAAAASLRHHSETCAFGVLRQSCGRIQREFQRASWVDGTIHFSQVVGGVGMAMRDPHLLRNDLPKSQSCRRTGNFGEKGSLSSKTLFELNLICRRSLKRYLLRIRGITTAQIVVRAD